LNAILHKSRFFPEKIYFLKKFPEIFCFFTAQTTKTKAFGNNFQKN